MLVGDYVEAERVLPWLGGKQKVDFRAFVDHPCK